jgi:hypothetical protein
MVPSEKIPNPSPPSLAGHHCPLCNSPAGGWRAGRNPRAGGAQRGDFFNQARNSSPRRIEPSTWRCYSEALTIPRRIEPSTWRCYSEALTITLEALSLGNLCTKLKILLYLIKQLDFYVLHIAA